MKHAHLEKALDKADGWHEVEAIWARHAADKAEGEAFDQAIRDNTRITLTRFDPQGYTEITARTDYLMSVVYHRVVTDFDLFHNKAAIHHAVEYCHRKIVHKIRETLMP